MTDPASHMSSALPTSDREPTEAGPPAVEPPNADPLTVLDLEDEEWVAGLRARVTGDGAALGLARGGEAMGSRGRGASPTTAAALSLIFPGLGQLAAGSRRRAVLVAAPAILLLAVAIGALLGDPVGVTTFLIRPSVLGAIIGVNVVFGLYHLVAISDAFNVARRAWASTGRRAGRMSLAVLVGLLVLAVGVHGAIGWAGLRVNAAAGAIFLGEGLIPGLGATPPPPSTTPEPTPTPTLEPSAAPRPTPTPTPTPEPTKPPPEFARDGRLNLLLIGADSGPYRWSLRTDTMILLSVDVETGRAALFGFPRNLQNVPLAPEAAGAYENGRFPEILNALYVRAEQRPDAFPGGENRGFRAVIGAIQELTGVPIDGMVGVDLNGFVRLVDALGGLWVDAPRSVYDTHYPLETGRGSIHLWIPAGCHHMDGRLALAYARSRHFSSDYSRMERQQIVLLALRKQLDPLATLLRFSELVDIAEDSLFTSFSREDVTELARLAQRVSASDVTTHFFIPPEYPEWVTDAALERIRAEVRGVFDVPPPDPSASPTPRPTETPIPEPCPAP
ncbi:MAG: LCP family protein [Chloroflexi bacterium]|nr:LCP family protein [Chloroflexota bacterium]